MKNQKEILKIEKKLKTLISQKEIIDNQILNLEKEKLNLLGESISFIALKNNLSLEDLMNMLENMKGNIQDDKY